MANHITKTGNTQENLIKRYKELFRFIERTGEEVFVFPKEYRVGISLKPVDVLRKEFELKDVLDKIQRGKKEHLVGKTEEFKNFLKRKHPQYAKIFSKNL